MRGADWAPSRLPVRCQLIPQVNESKEYWALRYAEFFYRQPCGRAAVVAQLGRRINDSDMPNSHLAVCGESFVVTQDAVLGGQDFQYGKRRAGKHLFHRLIANDQAHVGDSYTLGAYSQSHLRENVQLALLGVLEKPTGEKCLDCGMLKLSQIALLHLAMDVVAVRVIARSQVLSQRCQDGWYVKFPLVDFIPPARTMVVSVRPLCACQAALKKLTAPVSLVLGRRAPSSYRNAHPGNDFVNCLDGPVDLFHGVVEVRREAHTGLGTPINQDVAPQEFRADGFGAPIPPSECDRS